MKNLMDLHTHTLASGHAYSTLRENINEAKRKGLLVLGTSDHGYGAKGTTQRSFFANYHVIPKYIDGLRILQGIELNIVDSNGSIYEEELVNWKKDRNEPFDYTIASIHGNIYEKNTSIEDNTRAYMNVMDKDYVKILGHIDDGNILSNYDEIMSKASEKGIMVEVNNSSIKPSNYRKNSIENIYKFLEFGKKYGTYIIMNSDGHIDVEVGDLSLAEKIVKDISYDENLIVNYSLDKLSLLLNFEVI